MGVGAEGESGVVVAQHAADCFDINAVLERYSGECVSEAVQWNVFQIGRLQNLFVELRYGVRVVHLSGGR